MIYAITGLSGSGKSTIAKKVSKATKLPLVTMTTTRPMRPGEKHGVDYWFLSDEEYNKLQKEKSIIAHESFNVAGNHTWNYGIQKASLMKDCIVVLTPQGVNELKEKIDIEVIDIMIHVDDKIRMRRIIDRCDNQSAEEIKRRDIADKKVFKDYKPSIAIDNSFSIKSSVNLICSKINSLQNKKNLI